MAIMRRNPGVTTTSTQERLPVNSRRHRVSPENRRRVQTACNNCNIRRIRCSGELPCGQCRNTSRDCQYPPVVEKISIPKTELEELRAKCARLEQCLEQAVPDEIRRQDLLSRVASGPLSASSSSSATLEHIEGPEGETEGRLLRDPDGAARYMGSTSGAIFLDLLKEFMRTVFPLAWPNSDHSEVSFLSSLGLYQTFDSRPLFLMSNVDPYWHPSKTEMAMMMAQLRYFIQDGSGDFASGGIYYWGDLDLSFFDSKSVDLSSDPVSLRKLALFHAALAMTCHLESSSESNTQRGEAFFARARWLLGNPLDTTMSTIFDLPILSMMGTYLVEANRRDAAYIYVSFGMHIAVAHGIHRGWVHNEQYLRSFWTLYILDRWLSILMGRPPTVPDEAIKLPLPSNVPGLPPAAGLRAHVELAKISGYIVCNTFRIAPSEPQNINIGSRIASAQSLLSNWLYQLPPELRMDGDRFSNDRAACELYMAYYQLEIITLRPIFFAVVKQAVAERVINRSWDPESHPRIKYLRSCSDAARKNLRLGKWVRDLNPSRKLLSQGLHNIFNAAVILLLNQLLFDVLDETDVGLILLAVECFDVEAHGESNYPRDCANVLRELSTLIQRLRNRNLDDLSLKNSPGQALPLTAPVQQQDAQTAYHVGFILNPTDSEFGPDLNQHPVTTNDLMHQLAAWIEFDPKDLLYNPRTYQPM